MKNCLTRRTMMAGALGASAALPATALARESKALTDDEMIAYHAKEIMALLNKTMPEGMKAFDQAFIAKGRVGALAFPPGYKNGQPYADYSLTGEGWKMKGGEA